MRCPKCRRTFNENGFCYAISRRDNKTKICPNCGAREALEDFAKAMEQKMM
jgi:hypothetical protein